MSIQYSGPTRMTSSFVLFYIDALKMSYLLLKVVLTSKACCADYSGKIAQALCFLQTHHKGTNWSRFGIIVEEPSLMRSGSDRTVKMPAEKLYRLVFWLPLSIQKSLQRTTGSLLSPLPVTHPSPPPFYTISSFLTSRGRPLQDSASPLSGS